MWRAVSVKIFEISNVQGLRGLPNQFPVIQSSATPVEARWSSGWSDGRQSKLQASFISAQLCTLVFLITLRSESELAVDDFITVFFFFLLFYHDHTITYRESAQETADAQFSPCNIPAMHYGSRIQHNKAKIS